MQTSCIWDPVSQSLYFVMRLVLTRIFSVLWWAASYADAQQRPTIVTSFTIVEDWTQVIGGEQFNVINVIPARSEAHGFQLNPRHAKVLSQASLIVGMSPDFEPWLAAWGKANQKSATILWLNPEGAPKDEAGHAHNPHAWTDPAEVRKMIEKLSGKLAMLSRDHRPQVACDKYLKEIDRVDGILADLFRSLSPDRRAFISHHANLDLFARHYGLTVAGTILEHGSAESADPSVRHFSELLGIIRKQKIRVVVTDAGQNDAFAQRLTEDAGLPAPLALSFESLEPRGQPGDTWVTMMLTNGQRLHQALLK